VVGPIALDLWQYIMVEIELLTSWLGSKRKRKELGSHYLHQRHAPSELKTSDQVPPLPNSTSLGASLYHVDIWETLKIQTIAVNVLRKPQKDYEIPCLLCYTKRIEVVCETPVYDKAVYFSSLIHSYVNIV
jgi:hypothetical protein